MEEKPKEKPYVLFGVGCKLCYEIYTTHLSSMGEFTELQFEQVPTNPLYLNKFKGVVYIIANEFEKQHLTQHLKRFVPKPERAIGLLSGSVLNGIDLSAVKVRILELLCENNHFLEELEELGLRAERKLKKGLKEEFPLSYKKLTFELNQLEEHFLKNKQLKELKDHQRKMKNLSSAD